MPFRILFLWAQKCHPTSCHSLPSFNESWVLLPFQRSMIFPSSSLQCLTPSCRNQSSPFSCTQLFSAPSPLLSLLWLWFFWKALVNEYLHDLYVVKFKQYLNYIMSYTNPYSLICTFGYAESLWQEATCFNIFLTPSGTEQWWRPRVAHF